MKVLGVIPARLGSTRLEGKILLNIAGKPMIQHVWERARKSKKLDDCLIACDDYKVFHIAQKFGAKAVLTSKTHPSGSDRIAEAVKNLKVDIVVNIQGDEPLIHHSVINKLADALIKDKKSVMATVIKRIVHYDDLNNPNIVKVVVDQNQNALYFSRSLIPYNREHQERVEYFKHLGIYAYRKDFLLKFTRMPKSCLERIEKLEQLRVIEAGYKIKTVMTDIETIGVDTAEDLIRVERILKKNKVL